MGDAGATRQRNGVFRPIVAFDFDGTLTWKDSFMAFLRWRAGSARYALGMARLSPAAFSYLNDRDRGRLKARAVREFLRGLSRETLEADAQRYATEHARRLLRPDATQVWKRWQHQGARLVIVTASPESIVAPFARGLGADLLIGTRLAFDERDRVTGAFEGQNCRGPEKVARLREAFGPDVTLEAAYGDTDGDREMLALAEQPGFKVFGGRP
ncbi:MAG TPA: HAD-IB family hydrolase [Caulobacteraceae bacterium]|nr:HAD-IB family hydrolase [Caulobacteraceae bacterium]